jgi:L-methionine (R)-S-oxide reductase
MGNLYLEIKHPKKTNTFRNMDKERILKETDRIINGDGNRDEKLQQIAELLDREVDVFDWTGFYLVAEDEERMLQLGPYVGEETDHTRIAYGTGICGQAADTLETFVVQDVSKADNYLACSIDVKSEIVVPIMKGNEFAGELDIDSHTLNAITPEIRDLCEKVSGKLSQIF